ncbi:MAG: AbrB family transcriptional regulator [Pararhodobacter sp.]|nr:AbrB family transcriptional regulator [Pararhodobacter sp.]
MINRTRLTGGIAPSVILATYALGAAGGVVFTLLGIPLGMLLGSLFAVAVAAAGGLRLFGAAPAVPQQWRYVLMPVIGVAIGAGFPADFIEQAGRWWYTLAALVIFVPVAHAMAYWIYHRLGRVDARTSYFSAMPGGFLEALEMGEKAGSDVQMLLMLQFLRLILCIVFVPIAFALVSGQIVGSGASMDWPGAEVPLLPWDITVLVGAAVLGWWGGASSAVSGGGAVRAAFAKRPGPCHRLDRRDAARLADSGHAMGCRYRAGKPLCRVSAQPVVAGALAGRAQCDVGVAPCRADRAGAGCSGG